MRECPERAGEARVLLDEKPPHTRAVISFLDSKIGSVRLRAGRSIKLIQGSLMAFLYILICLALMPDQ